PQPATLYTLSLHDALPIYSGPVGAAHGTGESEPGLVDAERRVRAKHLELIELLQTIRVRFRRDVGDLFSGHAQPRQRRRLQRKRSEEHTSELQSRGHLVCR